ncbi:catenin beta-1-like isoform X2 [Dysidea avara]|uniref:catenin beta-1-like isoform X2 n=1 Tax=Dysidea avara TaxID=196820 RepID=UPI00331FD007
MLQTLHEKRRRLLSNLQTNPHQRYEIEASLRQVDAEIGQLQQQLGPYAAFHYQHGAIGQTQRIRTVSSSFPSPYDSAIGSETPSMVAEGDLDDGDIMDMFSTYDPQQQRAQANDNPSNQEGFQSQRIPSTQLNPSQPLQQLQNPSEIMKNAVTNLINYQDSTEHTAQILPELTKLLSNTDVIVVGQAAMLIHQLSKKEASRHAIIGNQDVITSIVQVIGRTIDPDVQRNVAGTLNHISGDRQGLISIYNSGGIRHLVNLLMSSVDAVLFYAITTLHNLLLHYEPSKMAVRLESGLERMVGLLSKDNVKFLTITIDCLHLLAHRHQDSKLIILASGGPAQLVRVMRSYSYEKLLLTCSRLLKVLSVCASNKAEIVQAGGMQVLAMFLNHSNARLVENVLWILRNLSDAATKQGNLDSLLHILINLLSSSDVNVVLCAAGILSNLTCNNAKNKVIVTQIHGTEALVHALINAGDREEITDPAVCTLRHLTSRHVHAEMAQNAVRLCGGITALANIMKSPITRWPLIKAVIGLIRNLALSLENHASLRDNALIPILIQLMNKAYQESSSRHVQGGPPGYVEGVYMDEIIEGTVGSLHILARDYQNRRIIRSHHCIPLIVKFLYSTVNNIIRVALELLCDLSQESGSITEIERENATSRLTELLHSPSEGIAYAAGVLLQLSVDRSAGNGHRLSANMQQLCHNESEYHSEIMGGLHHQSVPLMYQSGMVNQMYDHTPSNLSAHSSHPSTPHTGGGGSIPNTQQQQPLYMTDQHHMSSLNHFSDDLDLLFSTMDGMEMQATSSTVNSYMMEPLSSQPHPHHLQQQHHMTHLAAMSMNPQQQHHSQQPPSYAHHYTQQQQQQQEYLPPSPAVMDTSRGQRQWFDTDL